MITTRKELVFYIMADRIMGGLSPKMSFKEKILTVFNAGGIIRCYLLALRHVAYYKNIKKCNSLCFYYWYMKYRSLGIKLGFSIGYNSLGWGVVIPHWGTIVVNPDVEVGNYAVLHTCTCIGGDKKKIGDGLYLSTGSQIIRPLTLGDNVMVASHSLVNKSFGNGVLLAGAPAQVKKEGLKPWYIEENGPYAERVERIKKLRLEIFINER